MAGLPVHEAMSASKRRWLENRTRWRAKGLMLKRGYKKPLLMLFGKKVDIPAIGILLAV